MSTDLIQHAPKAHIRRKALARGPRQTRDTYGAFDGDPQGKTLCSDMPTTSDMSWAETRFASGRKHVTCSDCLNIRMNDSKAVA